MSIRYRILLSLAAIWLGYALLVAISGHWLLLPSFVQLEREQAFHDIERCRQAIEGDLDGLEAMANDWADWDASYEFVAGNNPDYTEENLRDETFAINRTHLLYFVDAAGNPVWGRALDGDGQPLASPALPLSRWPADHPLRLDQRGWAPQQGLLRTAAGAMLLVVRPIRTSTGDGPPRGTLVMGRLLTPELLQTLAERVHVDFRAALVTEGVAVGPQLVAETPNHLEVELVMADLSGRPLLRLTAELPRHIVARGRRALSFALAAVAGLMTLLLAVLYALLQRTVLAPVRRLEAFAVQLEQSGDSSLRLYLPQQDELGTLARTYNQLLDHLAAARQQALTQVYHAGMATSLGGVLHNVRNALSPVVTDLERSRQLLREGLPQHLDEAATELARAEFEIDRRARLLDYLQLASEQLEQTRQLLTDDLERVQQRIGTIEEILGTADRQSRAEPLLEAVRLADALSAAVALMPAPLAERLRLEFDPALALAPAVCAERLPLLQVLANLLINAVEALDDEASARVMAAVERDAGGDILLRLRDCGPGMAAETVARLFERGFSTKEGAGRGMGLHWSANMMQRMGGALDLCNRAYGPGVDACLRFPLWAGERERS